MNTDGTLNAVLLLIGYGYLGITSLIFCTQRKLQYFPDHHEYHLQKVDKYTHFTARASDGVILKGVYLPRVREGVFNTLTLLHLHGNAGNVFHRIPWATGIQRNFGCGVVLLDYRGFGGSMGAINEAGLVLDAIAGVDWITQNLSASEEIVLHLESIGSAVGLKALPKLGAQLRGCVIEGGLPSCIEIAQDLFPFFPVKFLMKDGWGETCYSAQENTRNIDVLSLHGALDQIVPLHFGRKLFHALGSSKKTMHVFPRGGHNDLSSQPGYIGALKAFYSTGTKTVVT